MFLSKFRLIFYFQYIIKNVNISKIIWPFECLVRRRKKNQTYLLIFFIFINDKYRKKNYIIIFNEKNIFY
jgi:hypothetical protein